MTDHRFRAISRPTRLLALAIIGGWAALITISFVAVTSGLNAAADRIIPVDMDIVPEFTSWRNVEGRALSSEKVTEVRRLASVAAATGILERSIGGTMSLIGIDPDGLNDVGVALRLAVGRLPDSPDELALGIKLSEQMNAKVGSRVLLLDRSWRVSGLVEGASGAFVLLPILQQIAHQQGQVSRILVRLKDSHKSEFKISGVNVYSPRRLRLSMTLSSFPSLKQLFTVIVTALGLCLAIVLLWPRPLWKND